MSFSNALPYFGGALIAAAAAGAVFALAWRRFFPPGVQARFWIDLSVISQEMLVVDETAAFLALYRRLGKALGVYLLRNLAVTAIGGAALVAAIFLCLIPLAKGWDVHGGTLKAFPPAIEETAQRGDAGATYSIGGQSITVARDGRGAACWTGKSCLGLSLLAFDPIELKGPPGVPGPVVIRAGHGDINPFWPYLSDLELVFLVVFMLAMAAGILWPNKKSAAPEPGILKQSDFALVQIAETFKPLIRALGDAETRKIRPQLVQTVAAPIFVTGLARSGTTTVLNALTRTPELASHQYRDFPFVAAPVTWQRWQGKIATHGAAVERPHKDRILITKMSPDAFEEPLWQQFFPQVHDGQANQRLGGKTTNPKFEAFFGDHLRKIMHLRGAKRYVSKGNYNVGRIEYLARLYPDATFVIPVREPVAHVASLVRQHALFSKYAGADPRVPLYLKAAGHYEFGPQRRPISFTAAGPAAAKAAFTAGDAAGYAQQWAEVYGEVARLKAGPLGDRIIVVPYEAFCADPHARMAALIAALGLADPTGAVAAYASEISLSEAPIPADVEAQRAAILAATADTAAQFGYKD